MTRRARRAFPGRVDQVSCARAFVKDMLGASCPALDEAVLLTSELCTNAIQHTATGDGGTFEVIVQLGREWLCVEVTDGGSGQSAPAHFAADDPLGEDGRGLEIVALVADYWGQVGDTSGRCVSFELRWQEPDAVAAPTAATALSAAEQLLAGTAESVNPATSAAALLRYATAYRRHLAALVRECQGREWSASSIQSVRPRSGLGTPRAGSHGL